jgi:hypothetical protein
MGSKAGRRATAHALLLLAAIPLASAHPYPRDDLHDVGYAYLMARDCDTYCGADNQYCCGSNEVCFTTNNIAGCSAANGEGNYLTTWTQTQTFTSTVATSWAVAPTAGSDDGDVCEPSDDSETSCGSICCAKWQYCAYKGQCYAIDGVSVPVSTYTTNGQVTTSFSQAYRITGTSTSGASATAVGSEGDQDGGGGLSGGAIAGIVIGSIAGVALLMLLCFCCIVRGLWAMLCGGGRDKERRNSRTATEDRYARRGTSAHSRRDTHRSWYGTRTTSPSSRRDSGVAKKKGENKFLLALTAIASTLAALLFLKRSKKKEKQSEKSRSTTTGTSRSRSRRSRSRTYTGSWSGSDSDITASTETGYSRRTRGTRTTRYTHSSRRPRDRDF